MEKRAWLAWASVIVLAVLCGGLALLQYRWIGEITDAERTRLHEQLQIRLGALSRGFSDDLSTALNALVPSAEEIARLGREAAYSEKYQRWRESHDAIFSRIALAIPEADGLRFEMLDLASGSFSPAEWPADWTSMRDRLLRRLNGEPIPPNFEGPPVIELPRFVPGMREQEWLLAEPDRTAVQQSLLAPLLNRYLGDSGRLDYDAEIVEAGETGRPEGRGAPDASIALMRMPRGGRGRGPRAIEPPPPGDAGPSQWRLLVWRRAGSLDALVESTRRKDLGISAGILALILATVALLVRLSRHAHYLAQLQMNFVAGVSHELRTPLTIINTAAYNLRGRVATRPDQVEKYGALIQAESEKLTLLVEQVLRFASVQAGHAIRAREPVAVDRLIDAGLRSSSAALAGASLTIEKRVDPDLPLILADELALRHALQNLVDNAVKYGAEGGHWIGISANPVDGAEGPAVEICVADHGAGIPEDEQPHIFDPFFRGRRAVQDQVHGTGLGLNLVKKIVEAHGGSIRVQSEPDKGTEFIVRIPAAPPEMQNEFAHSLD
jgi:signal transduction histidine kinase